MVLYIRQIKTQLFFICFSIKFSPTITQMKIKARFFIPFILLLTPPYRLYSQTLDKERSELQRMVVERQQKFAGYQNSLEKRSGFFGNKTKRDIKASHDTLVEIVKMDNSIISSLNRVLDFRNFEKGNLNYEFAQHNEELDKLVNATDTLRKQVQSLKLSNEKLQSHNNRKQVLIYFLLILSAILLYLVFKLKKQNTLLR